MKDEIDPGYEHDEGAAGNVTAYWKMNVGEKEGEQQDRSLFPTRLVRIPRYVANVKPRYRDMYRLSLALPWWFINVGTFHVPHES